MRLRAQDCQYSVTLEVDTQSAPPPWVRCTAEMKIGHSCNHYNQCIQHFNHVQTRHYMRTRHRSRSQFLPHLLARRKNYAPRCSCHRDRSACAPRTSTSHPPHCPPRKKASGVIKRASEVLFSYRDWCPPLVRRGREFIIRLEHLRRERVAYVCRDACRDVV